MTADQTVERAANKLRQPADQMAGEGGFKAKLAQPPGQVTVAPSSPQLGARPKPKKKPGGGGPNPWLIAGAALAAGIFLAKWIDWRGDGHPRD